MCQIQFIKKIGKPLSKKEVIDFANLMNLGSYVNNDAYGFSNQNGLIFKSHEQHKIAETIKILSKGKHDFLIGHNRYKTQGSPLIDHNNHPFETEHFVVVHNGVLSNDDELKEHFKFDYKVETDSYIIPALLEKEYNENPELSVQKVISKVASMLSGSFSVIVHFKPDNRLFYFKNSSTKFKFALVKRGKDKIIIGSTDGDNIEEILAETFFGIFSKVKDDYYIAEPDYSEVYEILDDEIKSLEVFNYQNVIPVKTHKQTALMIEGTSHKSSWDYYNSSKSQTISKKNVFKTLANTIQTALEENNAPPINRAYSYSKDEIYFYFREGISTNTLEMIQDMVADWAFIDYLPSDNKNPKQSKMIVSVDMKDIKSWFESKSMDIRSDYTDSELTDEINRQIRHDIEDAVKEESIYF